MAMVGCPYSEYAPATISFCEARLCGWVVEPSNAFSNVGYLIIGGIVIARAQRKAPLILAGIASILIGIGSFGLHGTGTRIGELLDVVPMYLLSGMGVMFAARRIWTLSTPAFIGGYVAIVIASALAMIGLHNNGIFMFAYQVAFTVLAEIYLYVKGNRFPRYRDQKWMLACFATAFFIWNLDKWNVLCRPDNHILTGHAVWHVLTAVTIYFFAEQQRQIL
jgi:hypothetical protein